MCRGVARDTGALLFSNGFSWGLPEEISRAGGGGVCGAISDVGASSEGPASAVFGTGLFRLRIRHPVGKMLMRNVT